MNGFLEALNRPANAFKNKKSSVAWTLVIITVLINTVGESFLVQIVPPKRSIDLLDVIWLTVLGGSTYLIVCTILWIVCRCFGSKTEYLTYLKTWGMTYFPTILCSIVVAFTETYFYLFWNSTAWAIVLNILFGGILLWKTILYIIYLREVAQLKRNRMFGAFIVVGIFILLLAWANGYVGLKTPIL